MWAKFCDYINLNGNNNSSSKDTNKEPMSVTEREEKSRYDFLLVASIDKEKIDKHSEFRKSFYLTDKFLYPTNESSEEDKVLFIFDEMCWTPEFTLTNQYSNVRTNIYYIKSYLGNYVVISQPEGFENILSIVGYKQGH